MGLHIERYGRGEAQASPLVFIHGSGWNTRMWYGQRDGLSGSHDVVLLDLPGHGGSPGEGCDSVGAYADAVYEAIGALGAGKCFLAGHSLGGAIAIELALAHPESLCGLVLIGTGARLRVLPAIMEGLRRDKEKTVETIVGLALATGASPALRQLDFDETMRCRTEVILKDFAACDRFDAMDSIVGLSVPTLILCGAEDRLTPPKYAAFLNRAIAGSKLVLIEGAGHMVMLEKPDEVNGAIDEFLRQGG